MTWTISTTWHVVNTRLHPIWRKQNRLTVEGFWVVTFLHWSYNYIPVALRIFDFFCHAVRGWFVEDGVLFKSQYRIYAVDCGRVASRAVHGACGGRQALIHHHHLGRWSEKPHWSVKSKRWSKSHTLRRPFRIVAALVFGKVQFLAWCLETCAQGNTSVRPCCTVVIGASSDGAFKVAPAIRTPAHAATPASRQRGDVLVDLALLGLGVTVCPCRHKHNTVLTPPHLKCISQCWL